MNYKYMCVIDAEGYYKTLVLVLLEPDENGQEQENIQYYTLQEGESLLEASAPGNLVKARWNGNAWEEAASPAELEQWEQEHPAPPAPTASAEQEQLAALALQQASQAATIEQLQQTNAMLMLQLAQTQSTLGGNDNV